MLRLAPGIAKAGFLGHGFGAGVVGVASDLGVFGPVRDQAKAAQQRFALGDRVIAYVGMGVAADEGAQVSRPDIPAGQLAGQVGAEVGFEAGPVRDGFVMGAHVAKSMRSAEWKVVGSIATNFSCASSIKSFSARLSSLSLGRIAPLYAFVATRRFPSSVDGPVDASQGCQLRIKAAWRSLCSGVQRLAAIPDQIFSK